MSTETTAMAPWVLLSLWVSTPRGRPCFRFRWVHSQFWNWEALTVSVLLRPSRPGAPISEVRSNRNYTTSLRNLCFHSKTLASGPRFAKEWLRGQWNAAPWWLPKSCFWKQVARWVTVKKREIVLFFFSQLGTQVISIAIVHTLSQRLSWPKTRSPRTKMHFTVCPEISAKCSTVDVTAQPFAIYSASVTHRALYSVWGWERNLCLHKQYSGLG